MGLNLGITISLPVDSSPDNNADLILEAFVASKSQKQFAIAGGADYKGNKIENEFLAKLKSIANENVKFLGHIDDSEHIKELHHHCFCLRPWTPVRRH